jgi:hypothetical protein
MTSTTLMKFLKTCFWLSIISIILQFLLFIGLVLELYEIQQVMEHPFNKIISGIMTLSLLIIFVYSLVFFYKYDKYSKSGMFFFFFHILYGMIYFYKVIWKRKRELVNSFESEPVLGNRIHIIEEPYDN